jgi:hypothetical protein
MRRADLDLYPRKKAARCANHRIIDGGTHARAFTSVSLPFPTDEPAQAVKGERRLYESLIWLARAAHRSPQEK